jgi:DNA-binding response OmpR family regulator
VLLDFKIEEKDGIDILREIRKKYPTKPVILLTSYDEEMSRPIEKGLQVGRMPACTILLKLICWVNILRR